MTDNDVPETLIETVRYFASAEICNEYMKRIKWPNGKIECPKCGAHGDRIGEVASRGLLRCKDCRKQFSHKVGTIFEDSPLPLGHWFVAVWAIANCKNGISSHELARALGVTQKSAWFMLHRIRKAMELIDPPEGKFGGPVEADATYVGGKAANMHRKVHKKKITGRGGINKTIVHGVLKRANGPGEISQIRADVVGSDEGEKLVPAIRRNVRFGAQVYTDSSAAYSDVCFTNLHATVDHSMEYVKGNVHINGMENFFSLLKRGIKGTYVAVAPYHLFRYVAEQVFRFNQRATNDAGRFMLALQMVVSKRLTYRVLTAQNDAGFMGIK